VALHSKIWNSVLIASFIISALSGIYVVNMGFSFVLPFDMLTIYMQINTIFMITAIFYGLWHIPYFKFSLAPKPKQGR
jgi:hypothetical protein